MALPLIPLALAGVALWLLSSDSKDGGDAPASGTFPEGGSPTPPETPGTGQETSASEPDSPSTGEGAPNPAPGPSGAFLEDLGASPYRAQIAQAEADNGLPQNLLARILWQESRLNADAISADGRDAGIAQVRDTTANDPGYGVPPLGDRFNPDEAIPWAGQYVAAMVNKFGVRDGVAAYNGGAGGYKGAAAQAYAQAVLSDVGLS